MHCEEIKVLLSSYVDDALTDEETAVVEEHLASCEACKTILSEYEALGVQVSKLSPKTPDMLALFRMQVEAEMPKRTKQIRAGKWILRAGAVAAALILIVLGSKLFVPYGTDEARNDKSASEFMLEEPAAGASVQENAPTARAEQKRVPNSGGHIEEDVHQEPLVLHVTVSEAEDMVNDLAAFYDETQLATIVQKNENGYILDFSENGLPIEETWKSLLDANDTWIVEIIITE